MNSELTAFKEALTDNKYHITKPRVELFKVLLGQEPQSIAEIILRLDGISDRVSVYRNIELFEKLGIVHRIYIGWKYKLELSEQFIGHHHHLSCLKCGKIIDIEDEEHIDSFIREVAKKYNFDVRRHQFEIDGYCRDCKLVQKMTS